MKKLLLFALLLPIAAFAQTPNAPQSSPPQHRLTGTVMEKENNAPMPYCTVALFTADSTYVAGNITNESGQFALNNIKPGDYRLEASFIGYEKANVTVSIPTVSDIGAIALSPAANTIENVVVTARAVERTANGYRFNPTLSGVATGRSSMEILNFAPGVWVKGGAISINGRGGTRVVVNDRLLDITGEELAAYLQNINAEQIASIEVLPQAGPQYDASFSGGILKITLKRSVVSGLVGSVGFSFATQEIRQTTPYYVRPRISLDYRTGKLSLYGSFSYNWDKHYTTSEIYTKYLSDSKREMFKENYNTATPKYLNGRFGAVYEISDKHSLGLDLDIHHMNVTSETTAPGRTTVAGVTSNLRNSFDMLRLTNNRNLSFNYKWKTDDKGSGLMVFADWLYADRGRTEENYSEESSLGIISNVKDLRADISSISNTYSLRADYTQVLTDKIKLEGGLKMNRLNLTMESHNEERQNDVWSPATALDDKILYREGVLAGYVSASAKLGRWNLSAGLRAENTSLDPVSYTNPGEMQKQKYTDFFPSFNAMYAVNPEKGHSVSLSYNRTIRRPGLNNLNPYRTYSDNYTYSMGNPYLKAYYMNSLSLTGVLKNSYSLTLGVDYEDDVITHITKQDSENSEILVSMPLNIDKVIDYYAVLSIPIKFTDWWRMNTDLTAGYSLNKLSDYSLTGAAFRGRIVNIFSFPKNFGADLTYWFDTGNISGQERSEPKFDMLDLNVKKSFFDNKFTVNLFVENILDFPKWSSVWTTERPGVFKRVEKIHSSSLGRTYGVTLRWNFRAGKKVKVQKVVYGNTEERGR
jgi:hypothetical protein